MIRPRPWLLILLALSLCAGAASADLSAFPLGVTPTSSGTVFRVWAPHAESVHVAGTFNGWNTLASAMTGSPEGVWSILVGNAGLGSEYKYVLRRSGFGLMWRKDPRGRRVVNSAGNSIVETPDFAWTDEAWSPPDPNRLVVYELHVGTAAGNGDGLVIGGPATFDHVTDHHLDEIADLGVNAVEILPVGEFPTDWSWGYNPSDIYAPESAYGGLSGFKRFVDACHGRGIAVILDVVYNHLGPSDLDLWNFDGDQIYFYPDARAQTPWGDTRPDYRQYQVRQFLIDNALHYTAECRVDGLRFDGFGWIVEAATDPDGWTLIREMHDRLGQAAPGVFTIAEHAGLQTWVTTPVNENGAGCRAQWYPEFSDTIRAACAAAVWGDPDVTSIANGLAAAAGQRPGSVVYYAESHDTAGELNSGPNKGVRLSRVIDAGNPQSWGARAVGRMAGGLVLAAPGMPMLFMGQEWNEDIGFNAQWDRRIDWAKRTSNAGDVSFFRRAIGLRTSRDGLKGDAPIRVHHVNDAAGNVLAFARGWDWFTSFVVICNVGGQRFESGYRVGVPYGGGWRVRLNSAETAYGGADQELEGTVVEADAVSYDGMSHSIDIPLERHALVVLEPAGMAPDAPTPVAPADGILGAPLRVILQCGAYSDPDGDSHDATQWQASADPAFASAAFDKVAEGADLASVRIEENALVPGTTYSWRARYRDSRAAWSAWSAVWTFTTEPGPAKSLLATY